MNMIYLILAEVQHYLKMLKHLLMVHQIQCGAEVQVGFDDTSLANITTFKKIAQQSTIKGRFFKFKCKITSDDNKVRAKVHTLQFTVNMEKRTEAGQDVVSIASGTTITFTNSFMRLQVLV